MQTVIWARNVGTYFCASTTHAEDESKGLQIGMPAISWPVQLLFKSAKHARHYMQHRDSRVLHYLQ